MSCGLMLIHSLFQQSEFADTRVVTAILYVNCDLFFKKALDLIALYSRFARSCTHAIAIALKVGLLCLLVFIVST